MIIEDMFAKPIARDIKGVIKVGQKDEENISQELYEYVVTNELQKHFRDFFESYENGINSSTDDIGVWISGHFGSGKSHLLKILSYILDNKEVKGKHAIDFFKDEDKIKDPLVIANMQEAANVSTDVVLFNIDSKSSGSGKDKDSITKVFLKVFNEMQGFSGEHPFLADFESKLTRKKDYERFKEEFKKISGNKWESERDDFLFIQDEIVKTLESIGWSKEHASNLVKNAEDNYDFSIEKFATMVKNYCESKGNNHHVIFLVDEIGQYIGDNSKLMLNLQTVAEDLGRLCNGKAWVIVTSQEAIDSMIKVKGEDFSKIQARFKTRLSLSSANVDEVIRKRILEKNDTATESLEVIYETKEAILKNLIQFTQDTAFKRLYENKKEFSSVYPFIPYQFDLVANVLNAIRMHGASGKHLSEGERSMLALFQESAKEIMHKEAGSIVPFNIFYEALDKFVDSTHRSVIIKAGKNDKLDDFDVEVLKVLFMIKYVKEIKANLENLTTLMVDNVDVDRIDLNKKIAKSLVNLERQTLISKNGDIYSFLTNEEQDINRAINNENVEMGEIQNHITDVIFEDIYPESKYRYDNRHNFDFNKAVDNRYKGNRQSFDIGLHIISSYYEFPDSLGNSQKTISSQNDTQRESLALKGMSEINKEVIIRLTDDEKILYETRGMLQINRYLNKQSATLRESSKNIIDGKKQEVQQKKERIRLAIIESLHTSEIYVDGNKTEIPDKNPVDRINDALKSLVDSVYFKLSYMVSKPSEADIKNVLLHKLDNKFKESEDQAALNDLISFINYQDSINEKPSLKTVIDKYKKAPYGFVEDDIKYLVAILFASKSIYLKKNSEQIDLKKHRPEDILKSLKIKNEQEKILIEKKGGIPPLQLKTVKEILKEFFSVYNTPEDSDDLKEVFLNELNEYDKKLDDILTEHKIESKFPGKSVVEQTKELFKETKRTNSTKEFFAFVSDNEDEFLDLHDELDNVKLFFEGNQKEIFKKACEVLAIFETSEFSLNNEDLSNTNNEIKTIILMPSPYSNIQRLPELTENFNSIYGAILEDKKENIAEQIKNDKNQVLEILNSEVLKNEFEEKINNRFAKLENQLANKTDIVGLNDFLDASDSLKNKLINDIRDFICKPVTGPKFTDPKPLPLEIILPKTMNIREIINKHSLSIKNEEDIDLFIEMLKNKLKEEFNKLDDKGTIDLRI